MVDPRVEAEARLGTVLQSKWRLDSLLGIGGMATVYAATHRNGRRGAVKILHSDLRLDPEVRKRFLREGQIANKVAHAGTVAIIDDDVDESGSMYLVMELLEGATLEEQMAARGAAGMPAAEVIRVGAAILEVLEAAHAQGVLHRDLKPANIFITKKKEVKVLDFGIARINATQIKTQAGRLMGTPHFIPPEQARGDWDRVDARADLFAVGATLYTAMTRKHVWAGTNAVEVLLSALTTTVAPIRSIAPQVPEDLARVIDRALRTAPDMRWSSAANMRQALLACSETPSETPAPAPVIAAAPAAKRAAPAPAPAPRAAAKPRAQRRPFSGTVPLSEVSDPPAAAGPVESTVRLEGAPPSVPQSPVEKTAAMDRPGKRKARPMWPIAVLGLALAGGAGYGIAKLTDGGKESSRPRGAQAATAAPSPAPTPSAVATTVSTASAPAPAGAQDSSLVYPSVTLVPSSAPPAPAATSASPSSSPSPSPSSPAPAPSAGPRPSSTTRAPLSPAPLPAPQPTLAQPQNL